jgi:exodeoxyribonuclease VII large subunit
MEEELTKISNLRGRALRFVQSRIEFEIAKIAQFMDRPSMRDPITMITTRSEVISNLSARAHRSTSHHISLAREEIANLSTGLRTLSPQSTLDRGYAVVQKIDGRIVRRASEVTTGEHLKIRLADGAATVVTE